MVYNKSKIKEFCSRIDWLELFDAYMASQVTISEFYKTSLPKFIRATLHEDYLPGLQTVRDKFHKIESEGRKFYCLFSRGTSHHKYWNKLFDKFQQSKLSINEFYEQNQECCCSNSTMYRQFNRICSERQINKPKEAKHNQVRVINFENAELICQVEPTVVPERT